jgi:hypothetical protein
LTLHGWTSRQFPNCLWVSIVQAALTLNFLHVTGEQAQHFAYVISECRKRNIRTFEPTQEAEEAWQNAIVESMMGKAKYFQECTPGYYNNEGKASMAAVRSAWHGDGSPAFFKVIKEWREADDLAGLDIQYNPTENSP